MPTLHKRRLKQQPITSTSDDRLLCRFGPDAFTQLCPFVRQRLWQPISGRLERVPRVAQVAARLALVLVMDGCTFDPRVLHHLAHAQFKHVVGCPHSINLPVEDALISFTISLHAGMLSRALCLSQLRGSAAGRNRLGKFASDEPLIAEQERAAFIQRATHSANQLLAYAAQAIQLRTPTFCKFVGLARSAAVRIGNSRVCHLAAQAGLVHHQPAIDYRINNFGLADLLDFTQKES